ncbi:hypothetical protein SAMN05216249_1302 [Acetitomaculum ruminis DSM 5522]|uniref:DUF4352 domain-containing protein n=1 Tax=Acetitomaculum ruminis DSM 5522 TaxID=1120918 RepID=A0A1I1AKC0_9FIRM|nr:hypothetical protein [Acetitomaculum ruminis]SFB38491.1 hypothetical protein SAMN05216249_1302 [Acetitomaculum ruminis DSM 5522]
MKKKLKWIMGVLLLLLFAGVAFGSASNGSKDKKEIATSDNVESGSKKENEETASENNKTDLATIDEQVLIDNNGIKITAEEYITDSIWGDGIKLMIENNTDKDYTIGCDALIVNDYMITDLFASEIAAGKSANETMYLYSSALQAAGIDSVGKVEMYFHAFDSNVDYLFQNEYALIQTSEFENMDTTPNDAGKELFNMDGIKIVGKTVDENSFWGSAILLYIENTSGKNIGISVDDMSINGFMMNPIFSTSIYDGKKAINDITILSSDLEDNGITSIDNVELKFNIYDLKTFETIKNTDPITFTAK